MLRCRVGGQTPLRVSSQLCPCCTRNGRIVAVDSGELTLYALGTGEYNEIALADILRSIIGIYKDMFKVATLSDGVLFSRYAQAALIIDEVIKEVRVVGLR